jgi:hypothetical protein
MKKSLILVHGDKGGVGKSFLAKILLDIFIGIEPETVALLDCDARNPDVAYLYGDRINTAQFDLSETAGWSDMVEWIESQEQTVFVVSLPAQVGKMADQFGGIFGESMDALNVDLNLVWMMDAGRDSVSLLHECIEQNWPLKRVFVVKNGFLGREFDIWEHSDIRKRLSEMPNTAEIFLPALDPSIRDTLVRNSCTFSDGLQKATAETQLNTFNRIRLVKYWEEVKDCVLPLTQAVAEDLTPEQDATSVDATGTDE